MTPAHGKGPPAVGIAASAGGLRALSSLLAALPADTEAAILIVQHVDPSRPSQSAAILGRTTALAVRAATDGDALEAGLVLVAEPNRHLVVDSSGRVRLVDSPPVNHVRPSADPLFESLAGSHGARAAAVILTGTGRDGAAGAQVLRRAGGHVVVQEPSEAQFSGMPTAAIAAGPVDEVVPLERIPGCIWSFATGLALR
jgi:two-component system chemotaxis response regulator CheB